MNIIKNRLRGFIAGISVLAITILIYQFPIVSIEHSKQQLKVSGELEVSIADPEPQKRKDNIYDERAMPELKFSAVETENSENKIALPDENLINGQKVESSSKRIKIVDRKISTIDLNTMELMTVAGSYRAESVSVPVTKE